MPAVRLKSIKVEKPWGRDRLPAIFGKKGAGGPIGEIWYTDPERSDHDLLIKYLFTSERLSIQVHPDDVAAKASGYPRGKSEAWLILEAEEDARIGLGLVRETSKEALTAAALDGSIEELVDWRRVHVGDCIYSPAGTIHAIGSGLVLMEVQQNLDLTYRLYDYGRARELHLKEGIEVSRPEPFQRVPSPASPEDGREILASGPAFTVERWRGERNGTLSHAAPLWIAPLAGRGQAGGEELTPGGVWLVEEPTRLSLDSEADVILAYSGSEMSARILG